MAEPLLRFLERQGASTRPVTVSRETLVNARMPQWILARWRTYIEELTTRGDIEVDRKIPGRGRPNEYVVRLLRQATSGERSRQLAIGVPSFEPPTLGLEHIVFTRVSMPNGQQFYIGTEGTEGTRGSTTELARATRGRSRAK